MRTVVDAIVTAGQGPGPAALTVAGTGSGTDTCLPWPVLHQRARSMASVLAGRGIGPGSRVGLLADTSAGLVTAIQAVWLRGAALTILPLPDRTRRPGQLAHLLAILADAQLDLVVVDEGSGDAGAALSEAVRVMPLSTLDRAAAHAAPCPAVRPGPGDLAVLQYTSGSTRAPRGVPVSHGNLAANLDAIEAVIGRDAVDPATSCWVSWLPPYHDMGLVGFLTLPMSRGCPLVL
ncbi:MAG TPA: AMP-binding protein, partial [Micromonosporaceae bacterium]|nr:AMP-binding protein [Micromonosporaceae bacterium]